MKTSVLQDMKHLSPSLGENYRCMLVWDTRTNKDVGWVMVRKTSVKGVVVPEDMVANLARCQWRSWNVGSSENNGASEF